MVADQRRTELAKIHIARKDLCLDEDTYRQVMRDVGGADSGSSGDLDAAGRRRVLAHFQAKGWRPQGQGRPRRSRDRAQGTGSDDQVRLIRHIWLCLADANVVRQRDEQALRTWIRATTRRYHPDRAGYSAPEFLPADVAGQVIEQLKSWAGRCDVEWR